MVFAAHGFATRLRAEVHGLWESELASATNQLYHTASLFTSLSLGFLACKAGQYMPKL
jgi:hypothetical protein